MGISELARAADGARTLGWVGGSLDHLLRQDGGDSQSLRAPGHLGFILGGSRLWPASVAVMEETWWGQGHYSVMSRCLGLDRTSGRGQGAADPTVQSGRDGIKPETNECSSASSLAL